MNKVQRYGLTVLGMGVGLGFFLLAAIIDLLLGNVVGMVTMLVALGAFPLLGVVIAHFVCLEFLLEHPQVDRK